MCRIKGNGGEVGDRESVKVFSETDSSDDDEEKVTRQFQKTASRTDRCSLKRKLRAARTKAQVSQLFEKVNRIGNRDSRSPQMMFTFSRRPKKSGISSYRILTTLDGGCTSSIVPTQLAQEWGVDIDRGRNDITLLMADGSKMAVDGIAYIFCKPDGCNFYKQIRFIVSPKAT